MHLERPVNFRRSQAEDFFLESSKKCMLLTQQNLDDVITLLPRQTFLIQSLEQSLGSQIRFLLRQPLGIAQFLVENIFLRARRKVGSGGHRTRARKHRRQTGDNNNRRTFGGTLDSGEQPQGTHQTVLDAENKLAYASPAFDELLFLLNGF